MNSRGILILGAVLFISGFPPHETSAAAVSSTVLQPGQAAGPLLVMRKRTNGVELIWPSVVSGKDGSPLRPVFEIERSTDLQHWESIGVQSDTAANASEYLHRLQIETSNLPGYYRVVARSFLPQQLPMASPLGSGGAEVFGYNAAFATELEKLGQITPDQLAALYPAPTNYVSRISYDPTAAPFWKDFDLDITAYNATLPSGSSDRRYYDFRLTDDERAIFQQNGFVVSQSKATPSFAEMYYRLWLDDLPVFVSTDAILQAWHRSYDMLLEEMEEVLLASDLKQMLEGMAGQLPQTAALVGDGALRDSVLDADFVLTVARSLLNGSAGVSSSFGQQSRVDAALSAIHGEQLVECYSLFGSNRAVDFSQFKIRGHYGNSPQLGAYFQSMMWLGRLDLRIAGGPFADSSCDLPHDADPRELGTAIVLNYLLEQSGQYSHWERIDHVIQGLVGWTDSLTFAQLGDVLAAARVRTLADLPDSASLTNLQSTIARGQFGIQNIRGDAFYGGKLPQSFTILGQKFVPDSWALSQVVYNSIQWVENGKTNAVPRRVPSCLDVAFSVLGNDQIVPDLVDRIKDTSPGHHLFRDGLPYQHNLAAVRRVWDAQPLSAWRSNVYVDWLGCLRELSAPLTDDPRYPETFRTRAWAMKTLNTQMASWSQLRHDTILYAKQSYTQGGLCSYPDGFVEPQPVFWRHLAQMADRTAALIRTWKFQGTGMTYTRGGGFGEGGSPINVDLAAMQDRQLKFLGQFYLVADWLEKLASKELAGLPWSKDDLGFFNSLIEYHPPGGYQSGDRLFNGWYPSLFYRPSYAPAPVFVWGPPVSDFFQQNYGSDLWDAIVADVHTDVPCLDCETPDPGSVLHESLGSPNLLMLSIKIGEETRVFAGPVLNHYEFEVLGAPYRLNDAEWRSVLRGSTRNYEWQPAANSGPAPQPPPWTRSYLVPTAWMPVGSLGRD